MLGLIASDTGQPVERVERDSQRDRWFTATAAQEYGFVDAVVETLGDVLPGRRRPAGLGSGR